MPRWPAFILNGLTYDLSHLDSFEHEYIHQSDVTKPIERYKVAIQFSHHCFTDGISRDGAASTLPRYVDAPNDLRHFCVRRYALSLHLPDILRGLLNLKCSFTGHDNFFVVTVQDEQGKPIDYEVYFRVRKSGKRLELHVDSAYPRDPAQLINRPKFRPVRLARILHGVRVGKPVKPSY